MILVGAIQDPIRKLTPGAPGYLVLATAPIWLAMSFRALNELPIWRQFVESYRSLSSAITLFLISLLPAAVISASYGPGAWKLSLIGLFSYGSVLLGWIMGFAYTRSLADIRRILAFYSVVTAVMLLGTPLEYFELWPDWPALGTEAMGMRWIRYVSGYFILLTAGFYRSPDIMGWHAIAVGMLGATLAFAAKGAQRYLWIAVAAWGVSAAILSGRRKMVTMILIFALVLIWMYWRSRNPGRMAPVIGTLLAVTATAFVCYQYIGPSAEIESYYSTPIGEVVDRAQTHGFRALHTTLEQSGFFGEGLGTASQGTRHLSVARPRTWQEGGLGKVVVELGVPGFLCFLMLSYLLFKSILKEPLKRLDPQGSGFSLTAGLTAFAVANAGCFVVSHHVFGDSFIMSFFSLMIGLVLSIARYRQERPPELHSLSPQPRFIAMNPSPAEGG